MKKLKTSVLMFLLILSLFSSTVYAGKVAYILSNVNFHKQLLIELLNETGFTVDKIDNDDIKKINLSQYDFMLIGNNVFSNENEIPVNQFPALILNANYMEEWHWVSMISQKSSNQILKAYVNNKTDFITNGFPSFIRVYTSSSLPVYYLDRYYKAPQLKTIVSLGNSTSDKLNAIIATATPGTKLKDGFYSNTRSVFFGATETDYWSNYTKQLFKSSALWLVTDFVAPVISNISNTSITNSSALIKWDTNKSANSTFSYGTSLTLNKSKSNNTLKLHHEVLLNDLNEKTTYYYKIKACNKDNYCSESGIYNFRTLDLTAPYLLSTFIENLTNSSLNVFVDVNEESYLNIYYGTNNESLDKETEKSGLATSYYFAVNGLNEKTTYYYLVGMCDNSTNCRNSSVYSFTTLDLTPPNPPQNLILEVINSNNSVKIKWDHALDDAINYYIHISNKPDSFDFENPNATTSSNDYLDNSASSEKERYYVVRAEDAAGNKETNLNIVGKFDLGLDVGYNIISLPLVPFSYDIDDIMHQDIFFNPVSEIKRFNSQQQRFETTTYTMVGWDTLSFQELSYGHGYFFKSDLPVNFTIIGALPTTIILDMKQGMNLFGLNYLENKNITEVIKQTPTEYNVTELGKRNIDGTYHLATYYQSGWHNTFVLKPGTGYWLKANKNFSLVLDP